MDTNKAEAFWYAVFDQALQSKLSSSMPQVAGYHAFLNFLKIA